jgi:hypothetical protein
LSILNTANFSNHFTFSVVQEGSDEASRQVLSIEPTSTPIIEDGQTLILSKNFDLTVSGLFKASTISSLQTLADNRTSLVFGGFGIGGQILQLEGAMNVNQVFSESASFRFNSPREATGGYDSTTGKHTSGLSYSTNGLALYKWGAASAGSVTAYGWEKSSGATVSFATSTNQQTLSSSGGVKKLYRNIYLPFGGKTLYFNIDVVTANDDGATTDGISIKMISYTGNETGVDVDGTATSITSADNGTVKQASITPTSDAKMVQVIVQLGEDDTLIFKNPTLQTNSTYNFVEFNT